MLNDPRIWGTHLKRREVVMQTMKMKQLEEELKQQVPEPMHFMLEKESRGYSVNDLFINNWNPTEPLVCAVTQYSLCKHTILTSRRLI